MSDKDRRTQNLREAAHQGASPATTSTIYSFPRAKIESTKGKEDALKRILDFADKLPSK
jgi:hypothetical protein